MPPNWWHKNEGGKPQRHCRLVTFGRSPKRSNPAAKRGHANGSVPEPLATFQFFALVPALREGARRAATPLARGCIRSRTFDDPSGNLHTRGSHHDRMEPRWNRGSANGWLAAVRKSSSPHWAIWSATSRCAWIASPGIGLRPATLIGPEPAAEAASGHGSLRRGCYPCP